MVYYGHSCFQPLRKSDLQSKEVQSDTTVRGQGDCTLDLGGVRVAHSTGASLVTIARSRLESVAWPREKGEAARLDLSSDWLQASAD